MKKTSSDRSSVVSVIQSGCHFKGFVHAVGILEVLGRVEGDIHGETVNLRSGSLVLGNIKAKVCRIEGKVDGHVVSVKLVVAQGGCIDGEIDYASLVIESGGVVSGACRHKDNQEKVTDLPRAGQGRDDAVVIGVRTRQEKIKTPA